MQANRMFCCVIKAMLVDNIPCKMLRLDCSEFHVLGTPGQVERFCRGWSAPPTLRLLLPHQQTIDLPRSCQQCLVDAMPPELHKQIGFVQQEPVLFSGSIKENVLFALEYKDPEIRESLKT